MSDILFRTGNDVQPAHPSWYRGESCNFNPTKNALRDAGGLDEYILKGWLPPRPFITREMPVTAFGSCFAQNVSRWLMRQQYATGDRLGWTSGATDLNIYDSHVIRFGEGMVNTFALRQQFEWALEGKRFSEDLWFGSKGELASYSEAARVSTGELFAKSDVFVITLGLSEVWCNKQTGEVFWRAIPRDRFDPAVHGFRVSSVAENLDNLQAIHRIIRRVRPSATIVITLSPVPLVATFRPVSCLTASTVSKAILRVAVDELMRSHHEDERLHYWPSYEIVKEYCSDPYVEDNRHPRPEIIDAIMRTFAQHYLVDPYSDEQMASLVSGAKALFAQIGGIADAAAERLIELGLFDRQSLAQVPPRILQTVVQDLEVARRIHRVALQ
jgi:hypothetical protein